MTKDEAFKFLDYFKDLNAVEGLDIGNLDDEIQNALKKTVVYSLTTIMQ